MAQIAKTEAEKATDNVAELGKRTADKAVDATREVANGAEDTARRGFQAAQKTAGAALEVERAVVRQSAEGATEVGEVFAKLAKEQAQNNVETFQALTRTIDWSQTPNPRRFPARQRGAGGGIHQALLRGGAGGGRLGAATAKGRPARRPDVIATVAAAISRAR